MRLVRVRAIVKGAGRPGAREDGPWRRHAGATGLLGMLGTYVYIGATLACAVDTANKPPIIIVADTNRKTILLA